MSKPVKSFMTGAAVLGLIGLVCKVIGAFYRIPIVGLIGEQGIGYYQTAYPVYLFLLAIASAGLPVAISKMVSERITLGDHAGAHAVFRTALRALMLLGIATTVLMALLSGVIAQAVGNPNARHAFLAISPSLFFVAIISAYRGYFQGMQVMSPTAFSQLIEQAGKLGLGLLFAYLWKDKGPEFGAAGAMVGVTLSEVLALIFMFIVYGKRRKNIRMQMRQSRAFASNKDISKTLLRLALPIVIGACAMPLVQTADMAIVNNALLSIGYLEKQAVEMFGLLGGIVNPLINVPAVLSLALAMSLVPAISISKAQKDTSGAANKSAFGLKLSLIVGLPCAVGFYLLSQPILRLLYTKLQGGNLELAAELLSIMAVGVLFLTILQTMTGVLQGLGKTKVPVINLFIGIAVKIVLSIVLIRMPHIHVKGAAIGTVACYGIAAVLNVICVLKYAKIKLQLMDLVIKPVLAAAAMGILVWFGFPLLSGLVSERLAALLIIAASAALYFAAVFIFGALKQEDMEFMPGGRRITRLLTKLKVW